MQGAVCRPVALLGWRRLHRRPRPRRRRRSDGAVSVVVRINRCALEEHFMQWKPEELRRIAEPDDRHISPFREDGVTYGTPTWIWSVVVDDGLYVPGYNGQQSRWYQAAIRQKAGRIRAAGMTKAVRFEPVDGPMNDRNRRRLSSQVCGQPGPQ